MRRRAKNRMALCLFVRKASAATECPPTHCSSGQIESQRRQVHNYQLCVIKWPALHCLYGIIDGNNSTHNKQTNERTNERTNQSGETETTRDRNWKKSSFIHDIVAICTKKFSSAYSSLRNPRSNSLVEKLVSWFKLAAAA